MSRALKDLFATPLARVQDKRTAKGKRKAGSFGNSRPRNAELRKRAAAKAADSEE